MATVHLLNIKRFEPIVRPTLLTGFLGYSFVIIALMFDLGQPWRIWHALVFWNTHSVMFEVAWCVMLYTTVLMLEFLPIVFERLRLERPRRMLRFVSTPLVVAGVLLSILHQSSLGSLYLIVPAKLHPLWYTPLLPFLFFISAVGAGIGMTFVESYLSQRAFGRHLEMALLEPLARFMVVILTVYGLWRLRITQANGALAGLLHPGYEEWMFILEIGLGVILPVALLLSGRIRNSPRGLVGAGFLAVFGFVMYRLNVSVTGMEATAGVRYTPSWMELVVSFGLVAIGMAIFAVAVRVLPIFPEPDAGAAGEDAEAGPIEGEAAGRWR
jgi:Ni/Fe-hydrogenase subunit HybB-like protein